MSTVALIFLVWIAPNGSIQAEQYTSDIDGLVSCVRDAAEKPRAWCEVIP